MATSLSAETRVTWFIVRFMRDPFQWMFPLTLTQPTDLPSYKLHLFDFSSVDTHKDFWQYVSVYDQTTTGRPTAAPPTSHPRGFLEETTMKATMTISCMGVALLCGQAMGQNKVPNPGFETNTVNFLPVYTDPTNAANNRDPNTGAEGWNSFNNNSATPGAQQSTAFAHSGTKSMRIKFGATPDFEGVTSGGRYNDDPNPTVCRPYMSKVAWKSNDIVISGWYLIPTGHDIVAPGWTSLKLEIFNPAQPFDPNAPCDSYFFKSYEFGNQIFDNTGSTWQFYTTTIAVADQVVTNVSDQPHEPATGAEADVRFLAIMYKPFGGDQGDTVYWDDVSLTQASACYANCDGSTGTPSLTAADFTCFLTKFRASDSYANCDGSTGTPSLTAADFTCFLSKFRAGCS